MEKNKLIFFGLILGASLIVSAFLVSQTFLGIKKLDNVVSVSGSAKQKVVADSALWIGNFSRISTRENLKDAYTQMKKDESAVRDFFTAQGVKAEDLEISPVFMNEIWKNDSYSPKEYNLSQNVQIKSGDILKLKELAKASDKLAERGVIFSAQPVQYTYSKLPELRVSLLPEAIKDAKNRAEMIAKSSDKKIGSVKSVSMGVVQVMSEGSQEISDYGTYDTSSINKEVMITVKTVFSLE